MPKGKPYTIYVESADGMKPGTKVRVEGDGVVGRGGMVTVQAFEAEGGPNKADAALESMTGGASGGMGMGDDETDGVEA